MEKILLTGGAGYLGSVLTADLLNEGYNVKVVDNFHYNQTGLSGLCHYKNLEIINGDIRDNNLIKEALKDCDIIIPLAALVGAPICKKDPVGAQTINHDAIIMMLKERSNQQPIIMPTTNSAYGSGDDNNYCTE